jgi:hypothetical protein
VLSLGTRGSRGQKGSQPLPPRLPPSIEARGCLVLAGRRSENNGGGLGWWCGPGMDGERVNESDAKLEEHWSLVVGQVSSS